MRVIIRKIKNYKAVINELTNKYGSQGSLAQKVSISKCGAGTEMEDLMTWKYLKQEVVLEEEIIFENPELFHFLSPKRMELIDYLTKNQVPSIKKLSEALHRNYKNIYDDLLALESYDIVEFVPSGKSKIPTCAVVSIAAIFED